jgi:hypothetical protein
MVEHQGHVSGRKEQPKKPEPGQPAGKPGLSMIGCLVVEMVAPLAIRRRKD